MAGMRPGARVRQLVPTLAYLVVALALSFVPVMSIAWVGAPRQVVMVGSVITALLLSGVHLMRRLRPMAVVVAGALVMVGEAATTGTTSAGAVLIECDLVYSCVLMRSSPRSRKLIPIIAAACLVLAVAGLFLAHSLPQVVVQSLTLLLAIGVSLWWGISVRAPMMQVEQERNLRELLAATEVARQREVVVAERLQISRELHDAISGHLSAIAMQTAAATTPGTKDPTYLLTLLHEVRSLSLNALNDMRSLIEVLRADAEPPAANPAGWPQLPDLLAQFRQLGTHLTVTGDLTRQPLPANVSTAAYLTVRECLYNAVRHAPGQPVTLHICAAPTQVRIAVSNPTKSDGGPDMGSSGYGLIGLEERVRLCGGHVESEHTAGIWRTCVVLPTAGATALEVSP